MIYVHTGNNDYLRKQAIKKYRRTHQAAHGEFSIEQFDGTQHTFEQITAALQNLPFLTEKKLVILRDPSALKQFQTWFCEHADSIDEAVDVVIEESSLDKRTGYAKFLLKLPNTVQHELLSDNELLRWLQRYVTDRDGTISASVAREFIDRVGTNQFLLSNEADKLLLHNKNITSESITMLCSAAPQSTMYELVDAILRGKRKQALKLYDQQRYLRVEPAQIVAMLAWQLHILAVLVTARGRASIDELAKSGHIHPYVLKKNQQLAQKLNRTTVQQLVDELVRVDTLLKTTSSNADLLLKQYIMEQCQA
jgi:DNA polymerase III subunit delta